MISHRVVEVAGHLQRLPKLRVCTNEETRLLTHPCLSNTWWTVVEMGIMVASEMSLLLIASLKSKAFF